jgi:large subunit ribosomal protein L16
MALVPSRFKYRKRQKELWRIRGTSKGVQELVFGSFGLKALEGGFLSEKQIEAARKVILKYIRKGGKLWIRVLCDKPVTSKGVEFSMGGGKGDVQGYVASVKAGRIIFELEGIPEEMAKEALRKAAMKLPIKTKFVKK